MKKNLLIIGGTGFLGYHFAKKLSKNSFNITIVSLTKPKKIRHLKKIKYVQCDVSKKKDVNKKIKKNFKYIFNFSGHVDHKNKKKTMLSHYVGTQNLSNHFKNKKIELFVQIGSGLEYGKNKSPQVEKEKSIPISNYAKSKYFASQHLLIMYKKYDFPVVIVKAYQVYGPQQDNNRLIPFVISKCLEGDIFPCSSGNQYRDFLYVNDFVNFLKKVLQNEKICKGHIFNLGVGKSYKIKKIISFIQKKIGKGNPKFGLIKLREEESQNVFPNIKKAKKILNWEPTTSLEKGLSATIESYRKKF